MTEWATLVSTAAAAAGLVSIVVQSASRVVAARRRRQDRARLTDAAQLSAVNSADIETLGRYLFDDIGAVRVSDVVTNDDVRGRTLRAFSRLTTFIGTEPPAEAGEAPATPAASQLSIDELSTAREQILRGEVWNGLALMRRHLELTIRASHPELGERMGAGQLIGAAAQLGALSEDAAGSLRYAVKVANRAIHGEPVDPDEALRAIDSADYGLRLVSGSDKPSGGSAIS
ncbi:hypothetical protein ACFV9C_35955 [Kribbella sp. NPDC059898]|uniref:hypothetical protein n=1 Tax=Kribbella sp. NPDC059898 TaxID=3346995 RepID=UPI003650A2B5